MSSGKDRIRVPKRIGNWVIDHNLGSGYSGSIWKATNPFTQQVAAIKVQDVDHECPTNRFEKNFYPSLQGGKGMPTLWAAGVHGNHDYLVIDLLGPSLDSLYRKNGKTMDLRSTICMAMQIISRLEFMHSRGILHRDIQLGNCTLGLDETEQTIYMIDFGFSKRYIDPRTHKHIPNSKAKRDFIGNYWFSSVNVHCRGKVPSRRDDMEALALMLIHVLTKGGLPWTRNGIPKDDKQHDVIIRTKLRAQPEDLCRGLPPVFEEFLRYCRRLKFFEQPDYGHWQDQFAELAREMEFVESDGTVSDDFVWPPRPEKISVSRVIPQPKTEKTQTQLDIHKILTQIANMRMENDKLVDKSTKAPDKNETSKQSDTTGRKENKENIPINATTVDAKTNTKSSQERSSVIEISSDEDGAGSSRLRITDRTTKQNALRALSRQALESKDNATLAELVRDFLEILKGSRSRVVTRDAFEVLEELSKKLEDSNKAAAPKRTKAKTSKEELSSEIAPITVQSRLRQRSTTVPKIETVKSLRTRLQALPKESTGAHLAKMMSDFCSALRATTGRTLTKDGMAFLEDVETRLRQL